MLETFLTVGLILTTGFLLEFLGFFGKLPPAAAGVVRPRPARSVIRLRRTHSKPVFKVRENLYQLSVSEMTQPGSDDEINALLGSVLSQVGDVAAAGSGQKDAVRDAISNHAVNSADDEGDGMLTTVDLAAVLAGETPTGEIENFDTILDRVVILQKQDDPALDLTVDTTKDGRTVLRQGMQDLLVIKSLTGAAPIDAIVVSND